MRSHCFLTLVSVSPAADGSMIVVMLEYLRVQTFLVLQAPMHAFAWHSDISECLAAAAGSMIVVMLEHLSVQMH